MPIVFRWPGDTNEIDEKVRGASPGSTFEEEESGRCRSDMKRRSNWHRIRHSLFIQSHSRVGCLQPSLDFRWDWEFGLGRMDPMTRIDRDIQRTLAANNGDPRGDPRTQMMRVVHGQGRGLTKTTGWYRFSLARCPEDWCVLFVMKWEQGFYHRSRDQWVEHATFNLDRFGSLSYPFFYLSLPSPSLTRPHGIKTMHRG